MAGFLSPVDICNRGLDLLGARSITSFSDGSRNATVMAGVYDRLRQAELRRNLWRFATRKTALRPVDVTTMLLVPSAYSSTTAYYPADIVSYLGTYWICIVSTTGAIAPVDANGVVDSHWDNYFGPLTVSEWVDPTASPTSSQIQLQSQAYHAGEIVYLAPGNGTFSAFISLTDGNTDDPLDPLSWDATTQYSIGDVVIGSDDTLYQSALNFNTGNDPTITVPVAAYSAFTTYGVGDYAFYTDGQIYQSLVGANLGNTPPTSSSAWVSTDMWNGTWDTNLVPQPKASSNNWHFLLCSLQPISLIYPVGAGPASQPQTKNIYRLPYSYLHQAPTDSKKGTVAWVGGPAGVLPDDWIFQGQFIISSDFSVLLLRFISDFQNVTQMDPMFCEGLAARCAFETCFKITQKTDQQAAAGAAYQGKMREARTINAIEVGPIDPPVDDYILVRQ